MFLLAVGAKETAASQCCVKFCPYFSAVSFPSQQLSCASTSRKILYVLCLFMSAALVSRGIELVCVAILRQGLRRRHLRRAQMRLHRCCLCLCLVKKGCSRESSAWTRASARRLFFPAAIRRTSWASARQRVRVKAPSQVASLSEWFEITRTTLRPVVALQLVPAS